MKKYIVKIVALALLIVMLACCLMSCNTLSGTYVCQEGEMYTTYKFSAFSDKLVVSYISIPFEGTYEINGDKMLITIFGESQEHSFSKDGSTIYIDGVAYEKEK